MFGVRMVILDSLKEWVFWSIYMCLGCAFDWREEGRCLEQWSDARALTQGPYYRSMYE